MDEKLAEEEGFLKEKNEAMAVCRKYVGPVMSKKDKAEYFGILDGWETPTSQSTSDRSFGDISGPL